MNIDVVLTPPEIDLLTGRALSGHTSVVFDVLRATSSMLTALDAGVQEILPASTMEEALELKAKWPDSLLCGERNGDRPDGFDLGNSPLEYQVLKSKRLISTTTNGTVALRACDAADEVLLGALLNINTLVAYLQRSSPENLLIVCAGTFRECAMEDVIAAGMLCERLHDAKLKDSARVAVGTFRQHSEDLLGALRESRNGRALLAKGRGPEIEYCAQNSLLSVIGAMKGGVIRKLPQFAADPGPASVHALR
jgi:2-phosphosulfolactate phosphatase